MTFSLCVCQTSGWSMFFCRKYYFEVKRLEEGFDLSASDCPKLDHPPIKKVGSFTPFIYISAPTPVLSLQVILLRPPVCWKRAAHLSHPTVVILLSLLVSNALFGNLCRFLQRPIVSYGRLHDKPLKHYFNKPHVKVALTQFKAVSYVKILRIEKRGGKRSSFLTDQETELLHVLYLRPV